jgi:hypothetical protein
MGKRAALLIVLAAVAVAVSGFAAPTASAGLLSCGATSKVFAPLGDYSSYFGVTNSGFENGSAGWSLSGGARVAPGNEPYNLTGDGGNSLLLPPGSTALSDKTCVNLLTPYVRFVGVDRDRGPGTGRLDAQVIFYGLLGNTLGVFNYGSLSSHDYASWALSPKVGSGLALPLFTAYCRVRLSVSGTDSFRADEVEVDPWLDKMG